MISFHNHSDYSNLRGFDCINSLDTMIETSYEMGHTGVALTDHGLMTGLVKFNQKIQAFREKGQKLLEKEPENEDYKRMANFTGAMGYEAYLAKEGMNAETWEKGDRFYHFVLVALDNKGVQMLNELCTRAWYRSFKRGVQRIPNYISDLVEVVMPNQGHIISFSACLASPLFPYIKEFNDNPTDENKQNVIDKIEMFKEIFGEDNFFLEVQPGLSEEQIMYNNWLVAFGEKTNTKVVVNLDAHYARPEDFSIHTAFITSSPDEQQERSVFYKYTYFMNEQEIYEHLGECELLTQDKIAEIIQNGEDIRKRVENFTLGHKIIIPSFDKNDAEPDEDLHQYDDVGQGFRYYSNSEYRKDRRFLYRILKKFHEKIKTGQCIESDNQRIDQELYQIYRISEKLQQRLGNYFLTVADIVEKIWEISLVAPGRGSCSSSIIAYILDITQIHPLRQPTNMPFFRFMDESKISLPDIDVDTNSNKKEDIIKIMTEWCNENDKTLAKVAALGTTKSKNALIVANRGLGLPPEDGLYYASLIPVKRGFALNLHDSYYGTDDEEPVKLFVEAMDENPEVWRVAQKIEGLITNFSTHAAGVVFLDNDIIYEQTGLMKAPSGDIATQYNLEDAEVMGVLKMDLLSTEALAAIQAEILLLCEYGYMEWEGSLKKTYDRYLRPEYLDYDNPKLWENICKQNIISIFQFDTPVGSQAIERVQPTTLRELALLNSVMRLMATDDGVLPLEKMIKHKKNIQFWYDEMKNAGLTEDEVKILEPHIKESYGLCAEQECLMLMIMDKGIAASDLSFADKARKIVAKKKFDKLEWLKNEFFKRGLEAGNRVELLNYVWNDLFSLQLGYSFSQLHTLSYSVIAIQEAQLYTKYPAIFWNTARLLVESGATEAYEYEQELQFQSDDEDEEDVELRNTNVSYFKMASAIGKMRSAGIEIEKPDINKSAFTFKPNVEENKIYFGLKGITRFSDKLITEIINHRPYHSLEDLIEKMSKVPEVRMNKIHITMLIKAGCFDNLYPNYSRKELIRYYASLTASLKSTLNLRNVNGLLTYNLIPQEYIHGINVYKITQHIRKYYKNLITKSYNVDMDMMPFIEQVEYTGEITPIDGSCFSMDLKEWDNFYNKSMLPIKKYIQDNLQELLEKYNNFLIDEIYQKYVPENIESGELEALSYYYTNHELNLPQYKEWLEELDCKDFFELPEEPEIVWQKEGTNIKKYKLCRICGTCVGRDKSKKIVGFLTPTGFIKIKVYNAQFVKFDKQITVDGVREKSWFSKGSKLIINGYRNGEYFIPKVYKKDIWQHPISKILEPRRLIFERINNLSEEL